MAASVETDVATTLKAVAGLPPPDYLLPAIAPVTNRQLYRKRVEAEVEEVQWYISDEPKTLVEPQLVYLKSICSKEATVIVFTNNTPYPVRALWLDFEGNEVVYSVLEPRTTMRYHTYVTHPWIVRELQSGTRMLLSGRPAVVGLINEQTVEVQAPPVLNWTLDTHCCFPGQFKSEIRSLLLASKKLEPFAIQGLAKCNALTARSCFTSPTKRSALSPSDSMLASHCSPAHGIAGSCKLPAYPMSTHCPHKISLSKASSSPLSLSKRLNVASPSVAALAPAAIISNSSRCSVPPMPHSPTPRSSNSSINTSIKAAHFTATHSATFPRKTVLGSSLGVEVMTPASNKGRKATTVNTGLDENCTAGPQGAYNAPKRGMLSTFKNILAPRQASMPPSAPAEYNNNTMKVELRTPQNRFGDQELVQPSTVTTAAAGDCCCPPANTHLGHLPSHLLVYIAELAHPTAWQTLAQPPKGHPDIKPTIMACAPLTPEQEQQQQDVQDGNQDQPPPLI